MPKKFFILSLAVGMAASVTAFGQTTASNTAFFDYDFTATDQLTGQFGSRDILDVNGNPEGDAPGQPNDNGGIFANGFDNRGPFVDGPLAGQVGFQNTPLTANLIVDTAGGFATESAGSPTNYPTGNIFIGQPNVAVGDTVRLISELSFTKALVDGVEVNSQFDNFFFGFRGGIGGGEFVPNDGVSQSFRYNIGADDTIDSDSNIQVFANANGISSAGGAGDGNLAFGAVSSLGIDIANNDFETDIFRIVTDAVVTATSPTAGITFDITTSIEDESGTVLGTTPAATTITDTGITLAGDRLQFAIRDGNSGPNDPSNLKIHRLAAIFNPTDGVRGDFDGDGDVDIDDLDRYIGNLDQPATGALADIDLNGDGTIDDADFTEHYSELVETSNGETGTFQGDLNLDGEVDIFGDGFTFLANIGNAATSWSEGDFNGDGQVDIFGDGFALLNNIGNNNASGAAAPATSAVPEPGSLSLLALVGLSAVARRRR